MKYKRRLFLIFRPAPDNRLITQLEDLIFSTKANRPSLLDILKRYSEPRPRQDLSSDELIVELLVDPEHVDKCLAHVDEFLSNLENQAGVEGAVELQVMDGTSPECTLGIDSLELVPGWHIRLVESDSKAQQVNPSEGRGCIYLMRTQSAFGTGAHPSTQLAAQALCWLLHNRSLHNVKVLDVGTGTGILSILAAKSGAWYVLALDIDPNALKIAKENFRLNQLSDKIDITGTPLEELPLGNWDLILANLAPAVLFELAPHLIAQLGQKGHMIVSGHGLDIKDEICNLFSSHGLELSHHIQRENWSAEIFSRRRNGT